MSWDLHNDLKCCAHAAAAAACTGENCLQLYDLDAGQSCDPLNSLRLLTSDQGVSSPIAHQIGIILLAAAAQKALPAARCEPDRLRAVPVDNSTVTTPL